MAWQLQEAKNKLSKVIQDARTSGLQSLTVHGKETAVVLSVRIPAERDRFWLTSGIGGHGSEMTGHDC